MSYPNDFVAQHSGGAQYIPIKFEFYDRFIMLFNILLTMNFTHIG